MTGKLDIPPFLRRRPGARRKRKTALLGAVERGDAVIDARFRQLNETSVTLPRVQLTEYCRLAETPSEESGMVLKHGVIPRRWWEGRSEREQEQVLMRVHLDCERRAMQATIRAERDARPEKVHRYAGMVNMEDVLSVFSPKDRPDLSTAKRAVRAARLEHDRFHFKPGLLQAVRSVIAAYKPGETKTARRSEFTSSSRMVWRGKNPKREGSEAHARWELLRSHSGRTVAEFLAAGGNPTTLKNAVARKSVKLGEDNVSSSEQGGGTIQGQGSADVQQGEAKAGEMAHREQARGGDAGRKARKPRAGRARRHR